MFIWKKLWTAKVTGTQWIRELILVEYIKPVSSLDKEITGKLKSPQKKRSVYQTCIYLEYVTSHMTYTCQNKRVARGVFRSIPWMGFVPSNSLILTLLIKTGCSTSFLYSNHWENASRGAQNLSIAGHSHHFTRANSTYQTLPLPLDCTA